MNNLGFKAKIVMVDGHSLCLRNVTEIHYKYDLPQQRVVFDSDVHCTGTVYQVDDVSEFEATLETKIEPDFYG